MGTVYKQTNLSTCRAHSGCDQYSDRCRIEEGISTKQLDVGQESFPYTTKSMRSFQCQSLCSSPQHTTSSILQLQTESRSRSSGYISSGVDQSQTICLPSFCSDREMSQETRSGSGERIDTNNSILAQSVLLGSQLS